MALARAVVNRPALLLADEPTGALDSANRVDLLALLWAQREEGQAVLLVTRDARVATAGDRMLTMRDGRIVDEVRLSDEGRRRPVSELALACATTTAALAVIVHAQLGSSWQQAFDDANGPHLVVSGASGDGLYPLVATSGVTARNTILRQAFGTLRTGRREVLVQLRQAGSERPAVDRPIGLVGTWAGPGRVVVEATAAAGLGLHVGDHVSIGPGTGPGGPGLPPGAAPVDLLVGGTARVISQNAFPQSQPGLMLLDPRDFARATAAAPTGWTLALRLRNADSVAQLAP